MPLKFSPLLLVCFFFVSLNFVHAQNYQWAINIGGAGDDLSQHIYTDNKGFVYVSGYFSGSNVDFDPSPARTFNLTSNNNSNDGYVAKYTTTGQFLWAFSFGGESLDAANAVAVDGAGNVYVTGFFRGQNVDFNPSATVSNSLNSNGESGGDPGYGGDIFIAKYNSLGQYQWAFNVGGASLGDNGIVLTCDIAGNIYTSGYFRGLTDFDPSSSTIKSLDASTGTIYVAKYDNSGQYKWAFNLGEGNVDNSTFGIKIDATSNVYLTGFFQGSNIDFNPSPNATAYLTSNGGFDIYVAKYDSEGNYKWAFSIGGYNADVGRDIELDASGNVYVAGDYNGTNIDFDPSPSATVNLTSNDRDVFIAKYSNSGEYLWAKSFGASGVDISWSLAYSGSSIYITGSFQGVMNFDPGPVSDNLTSNGANDFYITKFDENGNYVCAFNVGGGGNDDAYRIDADNVGNLYITGILSSIDADFDPSAGAAPLSTNGGSDIFIAKYKWPDNPKPTGTLAGSEVCSGGQAQLTFNATSGNGPFTIQYTDGTNIFTQVNVNSGVPFNVNPAPTVTTKFTLLSIKDATKCAATNNITGITATISIGSGSNIDFSFVQNACNPNIVNFVAGGNYGSYNWDFGDATTGTGISYSRAYENFGNYTVKLTAFDNACSHSVTKQISVQLVKDEALIINRDTTVCAGTLIRLKAASGGLDFCWSPKAGLTLGNTLEPQVNLSNSVTYYLTSLMPGKNLVANGNFALGNTGFSTDYSYSSLNNAEGELFVGSNPQSWSTSLNACAAHGTNDNLMLIVDGASANNSKVWGQSVAVTSNTNYVFSVWVESLSSINPAQLSISINGVTINTGILADNSTCNWKQYNAQWNSGNAQAAVIAILNNNPDAGGNNFALDDILFAPTSIKQDSIKINVSPVPNIKAGEDVTVCEGLPVQLDASGGEVYSWSPSTDLSNASVKSPVASPGSTTQYVVSGYITPGCTRTDTVNVIVLPKPNITISRDTMICKGGQVHLLANGGVKYLWSPASSLTHDNISNPIAHADTSTLYRVTVEADNGCVNTDSVKVTVKAPQKFALIPTNPSVCLKDTVYLIAYGGESYSWMQGNTALSHGNSIAVSPAVTTTYAVHIVDSICSIENTLETVVIVKPLPTITIRKSNDIDCNIASARLVANGGVTYEWKDVAGIEDLNIASPVVSPVHTQFYPVKVTDARGCSSVDSIQVMVNYNTLGRTSELPTAFTPNRDGLNDCYGVKSLGVVSELELSIFNRWGERVFYTKNPNICWDGNYKGLQQETGAFVYILKAKTLCGGLVNKKGTFVLIR